MKHAVFGPTQDGKGGVYANLDHIAACLSTIPEVTAFVVGGGKGVEALAEQYAAAKSVPVDRVAPDFHSLFGSRVKNPSVKIDNLPVSLRHQVFAARNDEIIHRADKIIFFWDGEFFEIGQLIRRALWLRKPVLLFHS